MRLLYYFYCLFFHVSTQVAVEYVYPVAVLDNEATILYVHQISSQCIQLFEWNPITNHTEQKLWSLFNPAGLSLLPHNTGFSFIDNGRLRVKLFQKRMPKAIDFDQPIFNINGLEWIDEHTCYCSAQQSDLFHLFQLDDNGGVLPLVLGDDKNHMYPQKVNTDLFFIESNKAGDTQNFRYRVLKTTYLEKTKPELVIDFHDKPIIFLHMISQREGFAIEHEKSIASDAQTIQFLYHHFVREGNDWKDNVLFSFVIPSYLFLYSNEQRLFESILPLLPRIIDDKIYFVDCSRNDLCNLEPYYYDLITEKRETISIQRKNTGHWFVPIPYGKKLCFGGTMNEEKLTLSLF